jgi:hypothetical protein
LCRLNGALITMKPGNIGGDNEAYIVFLLLSILQKTCHNTFGRPRKKRTEEPRLRSIWDVLRMLFTCIWIF